MSDDPFATPRAGNGRAPDARRVGGWMPMREYPETEPVDFVIVAYGLAVSPLDEDREAVALDMARHGFGAAETHQALDVAAAAHAIIFSGFRSGYAELDAVREKYAGAPWFKFLRGNSEACDDRHGDKKGGQGIAGRGHRAPSRNVWLDYGRRRVRPSPNKNRVL